jgi:hypothetical protein
MSSAALPKHVTSIPTEPGALADVSRGRPPPAEPADALGEARCPACRAPLAARMTRAGPRFVCRCANQVAR